MLSVPNSIKEMYRQNIGNKIITLEFYDNYEDETPKYVLSNDNIIYESMELNEGISTESNIRFGQCYSNKFTIEIFNIKDLLGDDKDFLNYTLKAYISLSPAKRVYPSLSVYPTNNALYPEDTIYPEDNMYPVDNTITYNNIYPSSSVIDGSKIPLFVGIVTNSELKENRNNRRLIAYDILNEKLKIDLTETYWNLVSASYTIKQVREIILNTLNIPYEDVTLINDEDSIFQDNTSIQKQNIKITARQMLESILELNCCFGHIDRTGKLVFKQFIDLEYNYPGIKEDNILTYPNANLYPGYMQGIKDLTQIDTYISVSYSEYQIEKLTGVQFITKNNVIVDQYIENYNNVYISKGNIFLEYLPTGLGTVGNRFSNTIYQSLDGIEFYPTTLKMQGMPYLEVGDYITLLLNNDDKYSIAFPVLQRTLKGIQSLIDTAEAKSNIKRNNNI